MDNFFEYVSELWGYRYNKKRVNQFRENWYSNNGLIRYEFPIAEGDSGVCQIHHMLKTLCEKRKIPDMEFFINRRDFPLLKKNNTEPYTDIFGKNQPLLSHNYEKYTPIFSMVEHKDFCDISIPTWEDWSRVSNQENNLFFPKPYKNFKHDFSSIKWKDKKPIAIFRGASTGMGTTLDDNTRLYASYLSWKHREDKDILLDAGITKWNVRPRVGKNGILKTVDYTKLPFSLKEELSPLEQSKYKYILHISGHVESFRLALEFQMGSVILMVQCKHKLWFQKFLTPYKHYIPIDEDLGDLFEKIQWCKENDGSCKEMVKNNVEFYNKYLSSDGILDFLQYTFIKVKKLTGTYLYPNDIISKMDFKIKANCLKSSIINESELKVIKQLIDKTNKKMFLCDYKGEKVVHKIVDEKRRKTHQTFMGKILVNSLIDKKKIIGEPTFVKTYGITEKGICIEYIEGDNFFNYLQKEIKIEELLCILVQITLTLQIALEKMKFNHYDLYPWNIVIKKISKNDHHQIYKLENGEIDIKTQIVPVIVDFDRSRGEYKNYCYTNNNKFSTIQDTLSLLLSTISVVILKRLEHNTFRKILDLSNFLSNTKYLNRYITKKELTNSYDLKKFIKNAKKYDEILTSDKYELDELLPFDFYKYIKNKFQIQNMDWFHSTTFNEAYIWKDLVFTEVQKIREIEESVYKNPIEIEKIFNNYESNKNLYTLKKKIEKIIQKNILYSEKLKNMVKN